MEREESQERTTISPTKLRKNKVSLQAVPEKKEKKDLLFTSSTKKQRELTRRKISEKLQKSDLITWIS